MAMWRDDDELFALMRRQLFPAVVGDILTFYQQHYANEAYLRTAAWRDSFSWSTCFSRHWVERRGCCWR